jgi:hypothetical protein
MQAYSGNKSLIQLRTHMDKHLTETANGYFNYLGRHIPQQCASDEYFISRSERAIEHLEYLNDFTAGKI